jgi:hypothetical protein
MSAQVLPAIAILVFMCASMAIGCDAPSGLEPSHFGPSGTAPSVLHEKGTASKTRNNEKRPLDEDAQPHDLASFSRILAEKIRPGDSLNQVEALLGSGRRLTADERIKTAAAVRRWQKDQSEYYADSVQDQDIFLRWPMADECTLQLQFRDGRLINHVPESYVQKASE